MNCATARHYVQRELDGELSANELAALHAHLAACGACRTISRQTAMIHGAVRRLAAATEPSHKTPSTIEFGYRRAIPWRPALAAAAVVALCVGGWLASSHLRTNGANSDPIAKKTASGAYPRPESRNPEPGTRPPLPSRERNEVRVTAAPDPRSLVRVRFDPASDVIARPMKTQNPNVTIIWVYPALKTAKSSEQDGPSSSRTIQRSES